MILKTILSMISRLLIATLLFTSCHSGTDHSTIATDSLTITKGQSLFTLQCSGCHNFRQDGIGPQLGGITDSIPVDWIKDFIKDPKHLIESGDTRSKALFAKYKTVMPSFTAMTDEEMNSILAFLHTKKTPSKKRVTANPNAIKNPIAEPIPLSAIVVDLQPITQMPPSGNKPPLSRIVKMDVQPQTGNLFILDLRGKLYQLENNEPVVYLDIVKSKPKFIHQPGLATGFGSFAFHPLFSKNGLFYTTHTEPPGSKQANFGYQDSIKVTLQWVLTEWKTDHPDIMPFSGTSRELFRVNMLTGLHGVQEITFNSLAKPGEEDYGQLYIGIGDGGSVENGHPELVQHLDKIWGKIIRIDPSGSNSANGQYGISSKNPFSRRKDSVLREIYAYGFRNPNRITWTRSGMMLATNIGHAQIESVNHVIKGHNYGWPIREGTFELHPLDDLNYIYPLPPDDSMYNITYPVVQYDHDEGKAIIGGYEYTGTGIAELKGKFLFGDIVNGRLFYTEIKELTDGKQAPVKEWQVALNGKRMTLRALCGNKRVDLRFGRDQKGEMYVFTKADGKVYKLAKLN